MNETATGKRFPFTRPAVLLVLAFSYLIGLYAFAQWRDLQRGPHVDEIEHLHVTVLMSRGLRPYVDFFEHHPPLFWGLLLPLLPESTEVEDLEAFTARARLLSGLLAASALVCCALIVWRAAGNPWTVVTFLAIVFSQGNVWRNGLADIRPDSAALAVWWAGSALVLLARSPWLRGLGIGTVFVASLLKPQWPLTSVILGVILLSELARDWRALLRATLAGSGVALAGLAATASFADLREIFFHVVIRTAEMIEVVFADAVMAYYRPWYGCPPLLRPWVLLLAGLVVVFTLWKVPGAFRRKRLVTILLILAAGSLIEIRFVYPFPAVDVRYYVFWAVIASAVLALLPQAAVALIPFRNVGQGIGIAAVALVLIAATDIVGAARPQPDRYWRYSRWLETQLSPGDTVWNDGTPLAAHDASYYWFAIEGEIIPLSIAAAGTRPGERYLPALTETDLPPCRIERGLDRNVRLMIEPDDDHLPVAAGCFERLRQANRIYQKPPYTEVWIVRR